MSATLPVPSTPEARRAVRQARIQEMADAFLERILPSVYHDAMLTENADVRRKAAEFMADVSGAKAKPRVDDTASLATINVVINGSTISAKATPAVVDVQAKEVSEKEPELLGPEETEPEHQNLLPPLDVRELPQDINSLLDGAEGLA